MNARELYEAAQAAVKTEASPADNEEAYRAFLEAHEALMAADVPTENRVMYYYVYSWWRHPIKRWRQIRQLKRLENI